MCFLSRKNELHDRTVMKNINAAVNIDILCVLKMGQYVI